MHRKIDWRAFAERRPVGFEFKYMLDVNLGRMTVPHEAKVENTAVILEDNEYQIRVW